MFKISDIIEIFPGMSSTVYLKKEFYDTAKNRKRMQGYKPITSHRKIFLKIAKSFMPNENKVHLLVGHYGTGKSHLLLMLANYFSQTLQMPELKTFFKTFDEVDESISKQIKNYRGSGRYLVAIPNYASKEDFSEILLDAINTSFKNEGFSQDIDSVYKESLRTLRKWEEEETSGKAIFPKFTKFQDLLSEHDGINSIMTLKNKIKGYDRSALNIFKEIYNKLESQPFRYNADNIVEILGETVKSDAFKSRYKGIVILFDEFDHTLKNRRISIEVVQEFAELCKNSNDIIFVGSLHKELSSFANKYSEIDFRTVQQRFKPIEMRKEGLEEIAGAIVSIKKNSPIYIDKVKDNMQQVYSKINDIRRLKLFDWIQKPEEINEKIIDAVYPLHPLAMACLLNLSTSIGSYNRTLFTFLGGEGTDEDNEFSYKAFINEKNIIGEDGLLNLYTTDLLVDYFQKELNVDNTDIREMIKRIIISYDSSLQEYKKNVSQENTLFDNTKPIYSKILKLMLVFEIVGIENRELNFMFGLNFQIKDKNVLSNALKAMCQQKVIFYNKTGKVYEFRMGTEVEWNGSIEIETERLINSGEINIADDFLDINKLPGETHFLKARKYNGIKSTDRQLLRIFDTVKNFTVEKILDDGNKIDYFTYYENQLLRNKEWKENYDGIVIYLIVENDEEIKEARIKCKKNNSDYIMVVIPEKKIPIEEDYLNLKAALLVKDSEEYKESAIADQARLDESFIGDINKGFIKVYNDQRNKYLSGKQSIWYGKNGEVIEKKPRNEQDVVNKFLLKLYDKFNDLNDDEFNRIHKALTGNKKIILTDAVNHLLEAGLSIEINTSFGNDKGFIRYLKNIFFDLRLLKQIQKSRGIISCEIEKDESIYQDKFPALYDMIEEVKRKDEINISKFIQKYGEAPYGLGQYSLIFFIAFIIKYFGDELFYKKEPSFPGEINIQSFDQVNDIVNSQTKFALFKRRALDDVQKDFLINIYKHYSQESLPVDVVPKMKDTVTAIQNWFENLNKLNQSEDFYDDTKIKGYLRFLYECNPSDAYNSLFCKMQTIFGYEEDDRLDKEIKDTILKGIESFDKTINNKDEEIRNKIFQKFLEIFNTNGKTYDNLAESVQDWYNDLDENQKELANQSNDSHPLIYHLKDTLNIREVIFDLIPSSQNYGLGRVEDWNTNNNIKIYLDKVKKGLEKIDELKVKVDIPIIDVKNADSFNLKTTRPLIRYESKNDLELNVLLPDNASEIHISYQNEDPKKQGVQIKKTKNKIKIVPDRNDQTIQMVSLDKDGNYSQTIILQLKEKFLGMVKEHLYGFELESPKNEKDAGLAIKDLIYKFILSKKLNKNKLALELKKIILDLTNEN